MDDILLISSLSKVFGQIEPKVYALNDLSLSIQSKSFTAIVGRSGSGKTTLLNIIGGLDTPSSGEVRIQGTNLYQLKDTARTVFRRRHIGYVFQFFNLIPELTAYENICLPSYLDHHDPDFSFINQIIQALGLESKMHKYPAELSGGEQQRIAVARALSCKPDILLADEPTGNLDKQSGDELMELLRFSNCFFEQTTVLVTHDLDIARTAERIITLEDGRILSDVCGGKL